MSYPSHPAFPHPLEPIKYRGLTKREYFAAMAMQGLIAELTEKNAEEQAKLAVIHADALCAELEKSK